MVSPKPSFVKPENGNNRRSNVHASPKTMKESSSSSSSPSSLSSSWPSSGVFSVATVLKWCLLELPLLLSFALLLVSHGLYHLYTGPITTLVDSYRLSPDDTTDDTGFYLARDGEVTYYNRRCSQEDVSTHDGNDLLLTPSMSWQERRDVMMRHGAVVMPEILSNATASALREYLEGRHDAFQNGTLPWHEKFWDGDNGNRLALGLGPEDSPAVAKAMAELGRNRHVQRTVEALMGRNPAIVEVSTLTTMSGAEAQNIHTDSDYFGSAVLYSRTFLHSYTLFIALQDTSARLGATTVCPGTHMCADPDLDHLCMMQKDDNTHRPNHFEASSNGRTGRDVGVLRRGDGMMFNQNVWHRGPRNHDPQFLGVNRVMFIVTFVSRREYDKGDTRQQGWGTYYYMRHSMWGQTFQDLKTTIMPTIMNGMTLPWRLWRSYGEGNGGRHAKGAVTWLEHWARQTANKMDFYTTYELKSFKQMMDATSVIPRIIWENEQSKDWDQYLYALVVKIKDLGTKIYMTVLIAYVGLHLVYALLLSSWKTMRPTTAVHSQSKPSSSQSPLQKSTSAVGVTLQFVLRLVVKHALLVGVAGLAWYTIHHHSPLFRRIQSGRIFFKPFPSSLLSSSSGHDNNDEANTDERDGGGGGHETSHLDGRTSTFPERMDVLIGTRFDAEWLGIYNDMLDYHPGNVEWNQLIDQVAKNSVPFPWTDVAGQAIAEQTQKPFRGVPRRFLLQDYKSGHWTVMTPSEVLEENRRALIMARSPLLKMQAKYWKEVLSESRFGLHRMTAHAKKWVPLAVNDWLTRVVFADRNKDATTRKVTLPPKRQKSQRPLLALPNTLAQMKKSSRPSSLRGWLKPNGIPDSEIVLQVGDYVLLTGQEKKMMPYRAKIVEIQSPSKCLIETLERAKILAVSLDDIQPLRPMQEGNIVNAIIDDEWTTFTVKLIHPLGTCGAINWQSGQEEFLDLSEVKVNERDLPPYRLAWTDPSRTAHTDGRNKIAPLEVGRRILVNYKQEGEFFDATIVRVSHRPGEATYTVQYDDGDVEHGVRQRNLMAA